MIGKLETSNFCLLAIAFCVDMFRVLLGDLLLSNNMELKTYSFIDGPEKPSSYYFVPAPGAWTVLLDLEEGIGPGHLWI